MPLLKFGSSSTPYNVGNSWGEDDVVSATPGPVVHISPIASEAIGGEFKPKYTLLIVPVCVKEKVGDFPLTGPAGVVELIAEPVWT